MLANVLFRQASSTAKVIAPTATLRYWQAFAFGRTLAHPFLTLGKGDVGHISLELEHPEKEPSYFSVWAYADEEDTDQHGDPIDKVKFHKTVDYDIKAESNRAPTSTKSITITEFEYSIMAAKIEEYREAVMKGGVTAPVWTIKSNCADYVYKVLKEANLIVSMDLRIFPRTPNRVFKLGFNKVEIDLRNALELDRSYVLT